jgi:hypothetical protein
MIRPKGNEPRQALESLAGFGVPNIRRLTQAFRSGRPRPKPAPLPLRETTPYSLGARTQSGVFQAFRPYRARVADGTTASEIVRGLGEEVADALAPTGRSLPPIQALHGSSVRVAAEASPVKRSPVALRADQLANATASTALSGPTTTLVRGDVWVWATVSSKEKEASCGLTMKLGTSIVCHPSANWTSETKSWSMDAIHSMLIIRPTVGLNRRPGGRTRYWSRHPVRRSTGARCRRHVGPPLASVRLTQSTRRAPVGGVRPDESLGRESVDGRAGGVSRAVDVDLVERLGGEGRLTPEPTMF